MWSARRFCSAPGRASLSSCFWLISTASPPWSPASSRIVVVADFLFTATAVLAQPITGTLLAWTVGYSLREGWIAWSIALYVLTGAFWLPVVWMQMRMRDLADAAVRDGTALPPAYHRLFWLWFSFGFPAFGAVLAIFGLMIARPHPLWPFAI
jgi:uncharacterized membrane protein